MTREELYNSCLENLGRSNCLLMQATTGFGKSKIAIDLINHLKAERFNDKETSMLLVVAKRVHKQTWQEEFKKWGGINVDNITIECYESLKKHAGESFDFVLLDEVHHVGSDIRLEILQTIKSKYMLGLSATIPRKLKYWFRCKYKTSIVTCDIVEAIEDDVLPEPQILLFPLTLDSTTPSEIWEINPKSPGDTYHIQYKDIWKAKNRKIHAIVHLTPTQKLKEYNSLIEWQKNRYIRSRNKALEILWLNQCGKRLEWLSDHKVPIVKEILKKLRRSRTITFCKTIQQSEQLGRNCIHSQKKDADEIYSKFNQKKINHITAVNILNENANLVNCKYAVFTNLSSSDIVIPQRLGRAMRHKHPVIIVPYFRGTREEEICKEMFKDYNREYIKVINSVEEI